MNQKDLDYFKKLLMEKREEALNELGNFKESGMSSTQKEAAGEHSAYTFHMADQGTDTMEREKAAFFATHEGRYLYHLEQALERIESGTYGICQECGKEISRARLEAVPHARLCIECKSKEEQSAA
jgi:RNA polymerase-binding protein DksA